MQTKLALYQPLALGLLRIALGLILLNFGFAKIFHFQAGNFTPPLGSLPWIAGLLELIFGALFTVGFGTRISAFILSGLMAAAYFIAHFPRSIFPTENNGYAAAAFSFVFLYFITTGAGALSIDSLLRAGRKT